MSRRLSKDCFMSQKTAAMNFKKPINALVRLNIDSLCVQKEGGIQ